MQNLRPPLGAFFLRVLHIIIMSNTSSRPVVTAVGRFLTPKNGEPKVISVIKVDLDGAAKEVIRKTL